MYRNLRLGLYLLSVLLLTAGVFFAFLKCSRIGQFPPASFRRVFAGTASRPYIYRQLLPVGARVLSPFLPASVARRIERTLELALGQGYFRTRLGESAFPSQVVLVLAMMYVSLLAFAITMWQFVGALGYSPTIRYLFTPLVVAGSLIFFQGFGYMYDFPQLFLFGLGLYLMHRRSWLWFLLVFACAALNKETSIFLTAIFAIYFLRRLPAGKFMALAFMQLCMYAAIQGIIRFVFRANSGSAVEWHFQHWTDQIGAIAKNSPATLLGWAAALALVSCLVFYRWQEKPDFIRASAIIVPIFIFMLFVWGFPLEIRGILEVYPIVAVLALPPPAIDGNWSPNLGSGPHKMRSR